MSERGLIALQRLTALVLAPCVIAHVVVIAIAFQDGLTAGEILGRVQNSAGWAAFYALFVAAAAIHAPIGLRAVLVEWGALPRRLVDILMGAFAGLLLITGLRAVFAVVWGAP